MAARSLLPLATAFAAHAGALLALGALHRLPPPAAPSTGSTEIDLDMSLPEPARPDARSTSAASEPRVPADPEARFGNVAAKVDPAAGLPERSLLPPPETAPLAPEPPSSAWTFSPFVVAPGAAIDLRAGVTPDMVAPPTASAGAAPQPPTASTTGGLSEGLAEHDVALGLGHGGAVLSAAETAARADAPVDGSATLDVAVHADGTVVARVLRSVGSSADWSRVADAIARSVDPHRMRLPAGRGWHVVLRVDAKVRLPDGRDVRSLHGPRLGAAPSVLQKQLEAKPGAGDWAGAGEEGHEDQRETAPVGGELGHGHGPQGNAGGAAAQGLAQRVLPTPEISVSGKVCSASIGLTPAGLAIGGGCSPENIGAHATRVVTGHIVSEGAL
ncbi:MAG TPA: hypothetical protein VGG39_11195 [Polyangiaceae bacterium]